MNRKSFLFRLAAIGLGIIASPLAAISAPVVAPVRIEFGVWTRLETFTMNGYEVSTYSVELNITGGTPEQQKRIHAIVRGADPIKV